MEACRGDTKNLKLFRYIANFVIPASVISRFDCIDEFPVLPRGWLLCSFTPLKSSFTECCHLAKMLSRVEGETGFDIFVHTHGINIQQTFASSHKCNNMHKSSSK